MTIFYLPDLGEGLAEAEIREWYVNVGDTVVVDQPLLSVETAKAVVDVPSPYAGRIEKLYGRVYELVKTHAPLVKFSGEQDQGSIVGKLEESADALQTETLFSENASSYADRLKISPLVRALAKRLAINLEEVMPSGPNGKITLKDVKRSADQQGLSRESTLAEGEALHGVRRTMALKMSVAHTEIAQITIMDDADIGHLPISADITVLVLQAIAAAVQHEPALNAWFDGKSLQRQLFTEVNIGIAIDTPAGLFVPVVKSVNTLSSLTLREQINVYKTAVLSRSLAAADMQGATIALSNYGSLAGKYATPMVAPPLVAILGCGRIYAAPVIRQGKVIASRLLPLALSADHRAVTGGEAARFLAAVKLYLEEKKVEDF